MIVLLGFVSFLLQAATPAAPSPADEEEIVVTARLTRLDLFVAVRRDRIHRCRLMQTSGDRLLDRLICPALRRCSYEGIAALPAPEQFAALRERSSTCFYDQRDRILAERRALGERSRRGRNAQSR